MYVARFASRLDALVERIGRLTAWLTLALVLLVAGNVLARYFLHASSVASQELEWHLLAVLSLLGASYTLQQGEHVRVDIFYQHYPERLRRWLDALVPLAVIIPIALFVAYLSIQFVGHSFGMDEGSPDPGGLAYRYLLKAFIPLGFALVVVQGLAMALSTLCALRREARS